MVKFSVLVPVYNVATYLWQCMDSIVGQTYTDLEIICIDDGSTDGSADILDRYAREDERIIVIHKENAGYGHSMNLGLAEATGDYISIVESDDYIARELYERLAETIETAGCVLDVVKTNHYRVSDSAVGVREIYTEEHCGHVMKVRDYPELFGLPCSIWGTAYRKDLLDKWEIRFLETPGASYQDTSFLFKVWAVAEKIYFIHEAYLFYRTDNAGSSVNSGSKIFCICEEIKEIERYMDRYGLHQPFLEAGKGVYICRAYMWNYYRLHPALRAAFWVEMVKKFQEISRSPGFSGNYWDEKHWEDIHRVLADPELFFWQSNGVLKDSELDQYTEKDQVYQRAIMGHLQRQARIVIYGAGVYGKRVFALLCANGLKGRVWCFAVTEQEAGQKMLEGVPVYAIDTVLDEDQEAMIIVAVAEKNQRPMLQKLRRRGAYHVLRVDKEWLELSHR